MALTDVFTVDQIDGASSISALTTTLELEKIIAIHETAGGYDVFRKKEDGGVLKVAFSEGETYATIKSSIEALSDPPLFDLDVTTWNDQARAKNMFINANRVKWVKDNGDSTIELTFKNENDIDVRVDVNEDLATFKARVTAVLNFTDIVIWQVNGQGRTGSQYTISVADEFVSMITSPATIAEERHLKDGTVVTVDHLPVITAGVITGGPQVDVESSVTYTYAYRNGFAEASTAIQWYVADDALGANEAAIAGATSLDFTPTASEQTKYLRVGFTATATNGTVGTEAFSDYVGPVAAA